MSWLNMQLPDGASRTIVRSGANHIRYSWNKVVKDFLATDSDYLFSTHNDVVFDPETLIRLLSWQEPLISALVFMRQSPVVPHIWKSYDDERHDGQYIMRINDTRDWFYAHREWIKFGPFVMSPKPIDSLAPISFTSTSCTLIHRSVLLAMQAHIGDKWFEWDYDYNGGGEDRRFFELAARVGYPAFVDRSCVVGHLVGDIPTSAADFIAWDTASSYTGTGEL
jgi:hypothetical protein